MKTRHLILSSLLALVLVACRSQSQPIPEEETDTSTPVRPAPGESPLPQPEISPLSPLPTPPLQRTNPAADAAVAHLAAELGVSPEEITVLSSEAVDWSDASLGCPQPGMMYVQVITPGYRFLLEIAGKQYDVHTDRTGQSVVVCQPASGEMIDPEAAFKAILTYLTRTYPGFGLDQREEWVQQDITESGIAGSSTWAWRSGEWTLEMSFPVIPQPAYEVALSHLKAYAVWLGTLEADGQVIPADEPISLSFDVGQCDETILLDNLGERAGVEITAQDGAIHMEQNLPYVCCAELALAAGRSENVIKLVETNVGQVCRCMCDYPVIADLTNLESGTYTVEVWGVQHFDLHPLELLGSAQVTIP